MSPRWASVTSKLTPGVGPVRRNGRQRFRARVREQGGLCPSVMAKAGPARATRGQQFQQRGDVGSDAAHLEGPAGGPHRRRRTPIPARCGGSDGPPVRRRWCRPETPSRSPTGRCRPRPRAARPAAAGSWRSGDARPQWSRCDRRGRARTAPAGPGRSAPRAGGAARPRVRRSTSGAALVAVSRTAAPPPPEPS